MAGIDDVIVADDVVDDDDVDVVGGGGVSFAGIDDDNDDDDVADCCVSFFVVLKFDREISITTIMKNNHVRNVLFPRCAKQLNGIEHARVVGEQRLHANHLFASVVFL